MPNIEQVVANFKASIAEIESIPGVICVYSDTAKKPDGISVQVHSLSNFEQIEGEVSYIPRKGKYPYEAVKIIGGVRFFCLLKADEVPEKAAEEVN